MEKFKEFYEKIRSVQKLNTAEERDEAMRAWEAGKDFALKSKKISSGKVHDIAEKLAKEKRRKNQKLWLKAFCRGYAETNAARQEEQKDMTEEIKKLWKTNKLMDAMVIARELNLAPPQVMQSIYTFTTAEERREREYAIAKDYHDSTGSWPEGYAPAFEEEADEAAQIETEKEEKTEAEQEQPTETEKATEEEHRADMPEQEEAKAEEVSPQKRPRTEQIIAACVMQIATQVDILRQEHEKFVNDTRQEFVKLTTEMSAAIKEAEDKGREEERKRILTLINQQ